MSDPYDLQRHQMVEHQLKGRGIKNAKVLEAFRKVPRHEFVPRDLHDKAYRDAPLPIGFNQTISQPYMVAAMTELAQVEGGDRVLEIGTGSGYQAAILAELGAEVYSIERIPELAEQAEASWQGLGYTSVHSRIANGTIGWEEEAPFDAIIVTAGAPEIPQPLLVQLADGGRLVIPLEEGVSQVLYLVRRSEEGFQKERGERCTFVPLIGEFAWKKDPRVN